MNCFFCGRGTDMQCHRCNYSLCYTCDGKHRIVLNHHMENNKN